MKTILSAGLAISEILAETPEVAAITEDVFPIYSDEAVAPYIAYRRVELSEVQAKTGRPADTAYYTLICYADTYGESIELAEAVREALDGFRGEAAGLTIRGIYLQDASEEAAADSFAQTLTFKIRI